MTGFPLARLRQIPGVLDIVGDERVSVTGVQMDSRRVQAGDLFAAIAGARADGALFAPKAVELGARAVLSSRPLDLMVPVVLCEDVRKCLGPISHAVYGEPTRLMATVGITGTNGKTTTSYLLESVLMAAGKLPALLGTVALRGPAGEREAELTTPEADSIARFAAEQRAAGATHLVMEVSSHAIDIGRSAGIDFEVAGFTNLTQDHLDHHGTMEAYGETKARLFTEYAPRHSVIMVDTPFGEALAQRAKGKVQRCSMGQVQAAELCVQAWRSTREGIEATIRTPDGMLALQSPLFGAHNLENLLVTLGCARALGLTNDVIAQGLKTAVGAPGRMERVAHPGGVVVLVDYAHTPDALVRALEALRPLTTGRLFVICGCGGDRDRTKRAPMGEAAVRNADVAVLTSDNPRTEEPNVILQQMAEGARAVGATPIDFASVSSNTRGFVVMSERAQAIRKVLALAEAGDTVLIAGKGHETYQIVGTVKHPFDDREEARRAIAELVRQ